MKKKSLIITTTAILLIILIIVANINKKKTIQEQNSRFKILTSFYPIYIMTINITDGAENVETNNMTEKLTGCIHNYNLTTEDLKKFEKTDLFIQNGLELERFMDKITNSYPNIKKIESAKNVQNIICEEGEHHEHEKHSHEENGHTWLSIENYISQINTITEELIKLNERNKSIYEKNSKEYIKKLTNLKADFDKLDKLQGKKAICLNEALQYMLEDVKMEITMVETDHEQSILSAKNIQNIIKQIKEEDIEVVFIEKDDERKTAEAIANETNAKIYVLDSNLNGIKDKNSYINAMKANYEVLKTISTNE